MLIFFLTRQTVSGGDLNFFFFKTLMWHERNVYNTNERIVNIIKERTWVNVQHGTTNYANSA